VVLRDGARELNAGPKKGTGRCCSPSLPCAAIRPLLWSGRRRARFWVSRPARNWADPCVFELLGRRHGTLDPCAVEVQTRPLVRSHGAHKPASCRPEKFVLAGVARSTGAEQARRRGPATTPRPGCRRGTATTMAASWDLGSGGEPRRHRLTWAAAVNRDGVVGPFSWPRRRQPGSVQGATP
jgi:hypothetical protein